MHTCLAPETKQADISAKAACTSGVHTMHDCCLVASGPNVDTASAKTCTPNSAQGCSSSLCLAYLPAVVNDEQVGCDTARCQAAQAVQQATC